MDLKDIKAIIDLMKKNSITEFELERQDSKIRLKRGLNGGASAVSDERISPIAAPVGIQQPGSVTAPPPTQPAATGEIEIKSPMIGTFYRAPSPEAGSYCEVGSDVNSDTVVCIIEAMKVMNEIRAPRAGRIAQILVEDAQPVEYGTVVMLIE